MARGLVVSGLLAAMTLAPATAQAPSNVSELPGGAKWTSDMPAKWNGTLLVWSRGYSNRAGRPESAPESVKADLLARGYAMVGSDYGSAGWALAEAVPAQRAAISAFSARHGKPRRVIGFGNSMGGLVTTALAEQSRPVIDGGIAFCASIGGSLGMMNMALDGAHAFRTLVAPDKGIAVVGIADDRTNGEKVSKALAEAMRSDEGRARVMLAGVLAGIPGWTTAGKPAPDMSDTQAQVDEIARAFVMGVFLPRAEQELRAGQGYSWNTGVDYRRQLALSGRRSEVAALYAKAGLNLDADLARLNQAPRIAPQPKAVAYMRANYTPSARPRVPLLAVQAIGDGATSPSMQLAYEQAAPRKTFASLWVPQAGHCNFTAAQVVASIRYIEARLDNGRWPARPEGFVAHRPAPMLRPCWRGGSCR
ncbi:alpha/beta hydrolase [Novosphingobium aquae]|uniref:Alpha/beta hydrolase n=1 Tax=Novosphingobium aquae TaxID=3133435 RepID=A0ABU8S4I3_9SPHN